MNGFRFFSSVSDADVNYKILLVEDQSLLLPTIEIALSSSDAVLLGDLDNQIRTYSYTYSLDRDEWAIEQDYEDYSVVEKEFEEAVREFESGVDLEKYKSKVAVFLIKKAKEGIIPN